MKRWYLMISEKGTRYRFKMSKGMVDIIGYIMFEDNTFIQIMNDGIEPISINKRFIISYKRVVE
jgi:hypothetical protein